MDLASHRIEGYEPAVPLEHLPLRQDVSTLRRLGKGGKDKRRGNKALALVAASSILLAAGCSDSPNGSADQSASETAEESSNEAEESSTEVAAARSVVEPYLPKPTSINVDVPLDERPPPGIRVAWLEGNVETITVMTPGFEAATEALDWELVTLGYDPANPQTVNSAMEQAVNQRVDYIVVSGLNSPSYAPALARAQAAGIPLMQIDVAEEEDAEAKGVLPCVACDSMVTLWGELLGNWIVADSDAQANVAYVTIPEFSALAPQGASLQRVLEEGCSACSLDTHEVTIADFAGGTLPSNIAAYLQSHPEVDYVYFAFGQMAAGVRTALTGAGIAEDVKFVVASPTLDNAQNLIDGQISAAVLAPIEGHVWTAIDALARHSIEMDPQVTADAPMVTWLWTEDNVPTPAQLFEGSVEYEAQFKQLWQVQ